MQPLQFGKMKHPHTPSSARSDAERPSKVAEGGLNERMLESTAIPLLLEVTGSGEALFSHRSIRALWISRAQLQI